MSSNDLFSNASLFTPTEPDTLAKLDINESVLEGLILRLIYIHNSMTTMEVSAELCLPYFGVLEPVMIRLRDIRMLEITRGEMSAISYVWGITDAGRTRALQYFEQTTYVGPAPVALATYVEYIKQQSLRNITVNTERLYHAFNGLVLDDNVMEQIGPAVNSSRSIFLYGPPGNGKTSVCERIVKSFGGSIFIPLAIEVKGSIIKVYDEYNHKAIPPGMDMRLNGKFDHRFRLIERPVIVVGGELTMESLDLIWSPEARYYEAPFQLKANGGALMIDDFGRQRVEPKTLLNRWIVPLEKRVDFLTLHTGTKIEIPFDELIVFSTNLNPRDLVDDAFLRRIRYKIPINDPSFESFRSIWQVVSEARNVPYADEVVDYFVETHIRPFGRPLRGCIPRDIIENILDVCRFKQIEPTISSEMLDNAANAYFVKFEDRNYSTSV